MKHGAKIMLDWRVALLTALLLMPGLGAATDELPRQTVLPVERAAAAVAEAMAACREDGYQVSVAVVDRGGVVLAVRRDHDAGAHTVDSSLRKAYTAASLRRPTQFYSELVAEDRALDGLHRLSDSILLLGGGFPIRIDDEVLGGIGVGGAPGAELDEACARAGLEHLGADLYTD